jgi:uncharacterized protein YndB with AHSA1/START domain
MAEYHESATIILNVPIQTVFEFVTNIENLSTWAGAFDEIRDFSGNPVRVGSTWTSISKFMGREIVSQNRVTEYDAPQQIVFSIANMAGDGFNTWTLEALDETRTRFTLQLDGQAKGIAKMAVGLIRSQADKQMNSDLANLKTLLEA